MISQGTISVLLGCHSFLTHGLWVVLAWKKLYKKWPSFRELVCILLHDVGHLGKNYLDDYNSKKDHWRLGAEICGLLFGYKYFLLVAGHCPKESGHDISKLHRADKYSRVLQPYLAYVWCGFIEPKLKTLDNSAWVHAGLVKDKISTAYDIKSLEKHDGFTMHDFYLDTKG